MSPFLSVALLLAALAPVSAHPTRLGPPAPAQTAQTCRVCHTRIYDEWAQSTHARAFDSPVFQQKWKEKGQRQSCLTCHTPEAVFETGLGMRPAIRKDFKGEGVSCISCHRQGSRMVGPHDTWDAAHPTARDEAIRGVGMCASCHDKPCECQGIDGAGGQLHSYLHSPQAARETCQSCHMPAIFAPTVELVRPHYPARRGRSHLMEASRDPEVLRLAMRLESRMSGRQLEVSLTNEASGHLLPGGPERAIIVETLFTDRAGLEFEHQVEYVHEKTRSRLRPAETRIWSYFLRPHYMGAEVRVYYRLFERQPRPDWILIDRRSHRFDAPARIESPGSMAAEIRAGVEAEPALEEAPELLPGAPAEPLPGVAERPNLRTP